MTQPEPTSPAPIPPTGGTLAALDQLDAVHPVLAYLAGLTSDRSQRVMRDDSRETDGARPGV